MLVFLKIYKLALYTSGCVAGMLILYHCWNHDDNWANAVAERAKRDKIMEQIRQKKQAKLKQLPEEYLYQEQLKKKNPYRWLCVMLCGCITVVMCFMFANTYPFLLVCAILLLLVLTGLLIVFSQDKGETAFFAGKVRLAIQASGLDFKKLHYDTAWREQLAVIDWAVAHKDELLKRREKEYL